MFKKKRKASLSMKDEEWKMSEAQEKACGQGLTFDVRWTICVRLTEGITSIGIAAYSTLATFHQPFTAPHRFVFLYAEKSVHLCPVNQ